MATLRTLMVRTRVNPRRFQEPQTVRLGGIWEASGKHLGLIWEEPGRHLGLQAAMRLQEAPQEGEIDAPLNKNATFPLKCQFY